MKARSATLVTAVILMVGCSDGGTLLPDPEAEYTPPDAAFSMSLTDGVAPLTITFTDSSTGEITEWMWDFGDGSTSTDQNPQHTFALPQLFEVRLVVHDGLSYGIATALVNVHLNRFPVTGSTGYGISAAVAQIDANTTWDVVAANTGTNSIAWWPADQFTGEFAAKVIIDDSFAAVNRTHSSPSGRGDRRTPDSAGAARPNVARESKLEATMRALMLTAILALTAPPRP